MSCLFLFGFNSFLTFQVCSRSYATDTQEQGSCYLVLFCQVAHIDSSTFYTGK
jgi:hypothetical protein